ncbi:hypothetical protein [Desulfobulbus alkaliphilus]|uniref:hypothetical protein n=1 Tax=Desulfobulbus alkaliphilus TaxID=869814 RepID=UPI0019639734|nr:hypothetical protein [Desulfobulbus alkaliphilus]MBM9538547.1 hypothetical protein [Desulfobulbus alkaliphilus]
MKWANKRIQEYRDGQSATFLEKMTLGVAHPVALLLAFAGIVMLFYGLWVHAWVGIGAGVITYLAGVLHGQFIGWPDRQIELYRQGQKATWLELLVLEHAHPVHCILALIGIVFTLYGLWMQSWLWISIGIMLNIAGHVFTWLSA